MERAIKVAIVDDNADMREYIRKSLSERRLVNVVGILDSVAALMEVVVREQPDIVITDLIMPGFDGYSVIEKLLHGNLIKRPPKIMVISAVSSEMIVQKAINMGVNYYMIKPFDRDVLYRRILDISGFEDRDMAPVEMPDDELITETLIKVGISPWMGGFGNLRQALMLTMEDPSLMRSLTRRLYPLVAEKRNTTVNGVERSIRNAIETAWQRGKLSKVNEMVGTNVCDKFDKLTNREMIALLTEYMMMQKRSLY